MRPQVDAQNLRITAGERSWSFEVDCRADCVRIELQGAEYRLRPLQWRDKRVLSRFAAAGEAFLIREFVRVSLADTADLPRDNEFLSLLFELARWYNSPDGREALPFDARTLSIVTLELCRSMALAPEHFDQRSADEVEALWYAVRRTQNDQADHEREAAPTVNRGLSAQIESPGLTKILIVPDQPVMQAPESSEILSQVLDDATSPPNRVDKASGETGETVQPRELESIEASETGEREVSVEPQDLRSPVVGAASDQREKMLVREGDKRTAASDSKGGVDLKKIASRESSGRFRVSYRDSKTSQASNSVSNSASNLAGGAEKKPVDAAGRSEAVITPAAQGSGSRSAGVETASVNLEEAARETPAPIISAQSSIPQPQIEPLSLHQDAAQSVPSRRDIKSNIKPAMNESNPAMHEPKTTAPKTIDSARPVSSQASSGSRSAQPVVQPEAYISPSAGDWSAPEMGKAPSRSPIFESIGTSSGQPGAAESPYSYSLDSRALLATLPASMQPSRNDYAQEIQRPRDYEDSPEIELGDPESFLDEMADRLAQAASQLGIDVEY